MRNKKQHKQQTKNAQHEKQVRQPIQKQRNTHIQ